MNKEMYSLAGLVIAALTACKPDYSVVQPVPASPAEPAPTIGYRIKRKTATGNCYTNISTEYEYIKSQLVGKEIKAGLNPGSGSSVIAYTYDANNRILVSTDNLPAPAADGVTAYRESYTYTGNTIEKRGDMVRGQTIDNTNYNMHNDQYTVENGLTVAKVTSYKEQDGRPMKNYVVYTYANGNLASMTIWTNDNRANANYFTYTYDDKLNPFQGRWLPEPSYLNGRNNLLSATVRNKDAPNGIATRVEYSYNDKGYPITSLNSNGCSTQYEYETY